MVPRTPRRSLVAIGAGGLALSLALAGCSAGDSDSTEGGATSLTFLVDNGEATVETAEALADAFNAENPDITVEVETRPPGGSEGDNLIKTRLATGEMHDMFWYNSGSLLQALNPDETLRERRRRGVGRHARRRRSSKTRLDRQRRCTASRGSVDRRAASSTTRTSTRSSASKVPTTWDEFMANNETIKAAGHGRAIVQTYGDTWTSQLFVLGDFYNVYAENPDWAEKYTKNEVQVRRRARRCRASSTCRRFEKRAPQRGLRVGDLRRRR